MPSVGRLQVNVFEGISYVPIQNARVIISTKGQNIQNYIFSTNSSGQTREIQLIAPSILKSIILPLTCTFVTY